VRATSLGHAGLLIETAGGSIVCDPWFVPAFFGSWFPFPRNDHLPVAVRQSVERPDFLYISHLHGDHLDLAFLDDHVDRNATVLLPDFPTGELERTLRQLGFRRFVQTRHGEPAELDALTIEIHVQTSITDGPGGDSALVVTDHTGRLVDQNDCRLHDLAALTANGPVDQQWLQYSGAIWYPMVYELEPDEMARLCREKVQAQTRRALRYVETVGARVVIPSAGPPCFLDPELFDLNVIDGDEPSIFTDQMTFLRALRDEGIDTGRLAIPGTAVETTPDVVTVNHPVDRADVVAIFDDKRRYLETYQRDWLGWIERERASWSEQGDDRDLVATLRAWWEPLLADAPALRAAVGANVLIQSGELAIVIDFAAGEVRSHDGEPYTYGFDIPRPLLETVVADRAVDWSNSLFLSCRFRAWREGAFNESLYNFLKSLSPERLERAEAEAAAKAVERADPARVAEPIEEIVLDGYVMERYCPHRKADLSTFGRVDGCLLTCELHGWRFELPSGRCLNAADRHLRVRPLLGKD
jgi:UDP-MurNAc hydroxylase